MKPVSASQAMHTVYLIEPDSGLADNLVMAATQHGIDIQLSYQPDSLPVGAVAMINGVLQRAARADIAPVTFTKPFRLGLWLDEVQKFLRQQPNIAYAGGVLNVMARYFTKADGSTQNLTEKEVAILEYLAAADVAMGREALLANVWGYQEGVTTHTLETHIYRLRQKIEIDAEAPQTLKTGERGYYVVLAKKLEK